MDTTLQSIIVPWVKCSRSKHKGSCMSKVTPKPESLTDATSKLMYHVQYLSWAARTFLPDFDKMMGWLAGHAIHSTPSERS